MSSEQVTSTFKVWRDAAEKFDYFVLGATGAICAYALQNFTPARIGANPPTLQLFGLLLLFASAYAGFRRIESLNTALRDNLSRLQAEGNHDDLRAGMAGAGIFFDYTLGRHLSPAELPGMAEEHRVKYAALRIVEAKSQVRAASFYGWRNRLLFLGFFTLFAAKVWSAYA